MSFLGFGAAPRKSVLLLNVDSASVGGAYAQFAPGKRPRIYFTARLPIEATGDLPTEADMLRTLNALVETLVTGGAPTLHRETGSGHVDQVEVSIGAPWQETRIEVKTIEEKGKEFVFSKGMLDAATKEVGIKEGRVQTGELIVATLLNGYETGKPFGKRAKRADLIVLSSSLPKTTLEQVEASLRKAYHTHQISFTAFAPLAFAVFRDMYPHEKDFLVLDFSGDSTDIGFVKGGLLVDVSSIPLGTHRFSKAIHGEHGGAGVIDMARNAAFGKRVAEVEGEWTDALSTLLKDFAKRHALPRTVFLIASDESREFAKHLLDAPVLHALWLSDDPLRVIPVLPSQFSTFVETRGSASGDSILAMLALYFQKRLGR